MSGETQPAGGRNNRVWAIGIAAVVLAVLLAVVLTTRGSGDEDPAEVAEGPSESAAPVATETAQPTTAADPSPAPTEAAPPAPSEPVPATQAPQPSDDDVSAFVDQYGPGQHTVTGDIDGDGLTDVVVASIRDDTTRIDVGFWDGTAFRHDSDEGGPAQLIDGVAVNDYNGAPGAEVVTRQSVGEAGRSLSVWGGKRGKLARQTGKGGCWDGFHTYGISGANIEPGRITATCDGSPLPPEAWSSDVYEWDDGAWVHTESITPEE